MTTIEAEKFAIRISKKPKRICRTLHFCELCRTSINWREEYFDGGYGARAHVECVLAEIKKGQP